MMNRGAALGLALYICCAVALALLTVREAPGEARPDMIRAAERMRDCSADIVSFKGTKGLALDPALDINRTGFIGEAFTGITTTLGSLEAKRTASSPDMAALAVRLIRQAGIEKGSRIAVNASGSFPGLAVAAVCACETLGMEAVLIVSCGASTYGANQPDCTVLDMLMRLRETGRIQTGVAAASVGGSDDKGGGMPDPAGPGFLRQKILSYGVELLEYDLERRMQLYEGARLFINIGGNLVGGNFGAGESPGGLIFPVDLPEGAQGLTALFLGRGIPVLQMLDVKALSGANGIPFDPFPLPGPGESAVYSRRQFNRPLCLILFSGAALILALTAFPCGVKARRARREGR